MERERRPTRTLCSNAQELWGKILWVSRRRGYRTCGTTGAEERSSAGTCSHQAEWAGRKSAKASGPWRSQEPGESNRERVQGYKRVPQGLSQSLPL